MPERETSDSPQKSPFLAAVLGMLSPGLGHVYLGRWGRALLWFTVVIGAIFILVPELPASTSLSVDSVVATRQAVVQFAALPALVLSVMSVVDAYWLAATDRAVSEDGPKEEASRACPNCGKELDEDIDFCHWCTTKLDEYEA